MMYADQTPKGAPGGPTLASHNPLSGLTPKSIIANDLQNRKPRKMSNNSNQQNDEGPDAENAKKQSSGNEVSQIAQQQPSTQYNNNIMFIKYSPNIGRKRDKS